MNHIERMRALRAQVDIIIEHTETLAALDAHGSDVIGLCAFVSQPAGRSDLNRHLAVPTVELRALVKRRIGATRPSLRISPSASSRRRRRGRMCSVRRAKGCRRRGR